MDAIDVTGSANFSPIELAPQDIILVFHQVNLDYERDKLNQFVRSQVKERLLHLQDNTLLAGDVAANFFKQIESKNALLASSEFKFNNQS
ncbi:hypothetical protein RZS08_64525, partial [Arthrospira platensis SPKY1]|nr:hypothetical protein [Arthrospira platensis SPKY1]